MAVIAAATCLVPLLGVWLLVSLSCAPSGTG